MWLNMKRLMPGRHKVREYKYLSLFHSVGLLSFALLFVSCAVPSLEIQSLNKVPAGYDDAEQEKEAAANDMACSYFYFLWGKTAENNQNFEEAQEAYEKALLAM
jgi:hypothetical protein